jgi:hypothetical protein
LPNISEKILPSTRRTLYRTGPTSQTPYQILVLTVVAYSWWAAVWAAMACSWVAILGASLA